MLRMPCFWRRTSSSSAMAGERWVSAIRPMWYWGFCLKKVSVLRLKVVMLPAKTWRL